MSAVAMIVFAFSGTPAFFPIAAEMRNPRHYTRSMLICQAIVTTVYLVIGVVVYYYCGSYVASPALGSAGALMKKVCYGIALPGLLVTEMIVSHVSLLQPAIQGEHRSLTFRIVPSQNAPCSLPRRFEASYRKHIHTLGHMALMYLCGRACSIHHRQRCSQIRQLDRTDRRAARSSDLPHPIRLHVALRQLDNRQQRATLAMVACRLLERICDCRWMLCHGWRHVWCCDRADQGLFGRRWCFFLVLCG